MNRRKKCLAEKRNGGSGTFGYYFFSSKKNEGLKISGKKQHINTKYWYVWGVLCMPDCLRVYFHCVCCVLCIRNQKQCGWKLVWY